MINNSNKPEPTLSSHEQAFFRGIEDQKRVGAESAKRHADNLNENSMRSKTMQDLLKRGEFQGMSQAEIAALVTDSMKAMAAALRAKR